MSPEARRGPVSPAEAAEMKTAVIIPDQVFDVFNELIAQNLTNGYARVVQKEVESRLAQQGMNLSEVYKNHWLDVEDSYREAGWKVRYDRPVYWGGENFDAYFEFSNRKD